MDGEITCEHAAAITKGIDSLPNLPTDVVDKVADAFVVKARDTSPRKLAQLATSILAEVAPDHALSNDALEDRAVRQREKAVESRSFLWGNDGEGSVWFKGQLPEAEAEPLVRTLTAMVAAGKREELDHDTQLRDAGADPLTRHHHRSAQRRRTPAQRAADALTQLLNQVLDGGTGTGRTGEGGPRATIRVTMTLDDLTTRASAGGCWIPAPNSPPANSAGCSPKPTSSPPCSVASQRSSTGAEPDASPPQPNAR